MNIAVLMCCSALICRVLLTAVCFYIRVYTDPGKSWNFTVPGKRHMSWKTMEIPGILKQHFWIFNFCFE